jgi:hypothetical protein
MNDWKKYVMDGHTECDLPPLGIEPVQDYTRFRTWVDTNIERIERSIDNHLKEVQLCSHLDNEAEQMHNCLDQGIKGIEDALHHLKSLKDQLNS